MVWRKLGRYLVTEKEWWLQTLWPKFCERLQAWLSKMCAGRKSGKDE